MRNLILTFSAVAIMCAGCTSEQKNIPELKGDAFRVAKVVAEDSGNKEETEAIGKEGFRLIEYEPETAELLQQSVWKNNAGTWTPETDIKAVNGGHIVALYPSGNKIGGKDITIKPGFNNMSAVEDIDRKTTNQATLTFRHLMSQVTYNITDQEGNKVEIGNETGQISSITLIQPSEATVLLYDGVITATGKMTTLPLHKGLNYVIPGAQQTYTIEAKYNNDGQIEEYTYDFQAPLKRNDNYTVNLKLNTGHPLEITVSVEEWNVEEREGTLEKVEEDDVKVYTERVKVGDVYYFLDGKNLTASVTYGGEQFAPTPEYDGHDVVIPSTIEYDNKTFTVTQIGNEAFQNCELMKSIKLPETLISINENAFYYCKALKEIIVPQSVRRIEHDAMPYCDALEVVELPDEMEYIGPYAFYNDAKVKRITIPRGLSKLEEGSYAGLASITELEIPDGISTIGNGALSDLWSLKELVLPSSVVELEEYAISFCLNLEKITLSENLKVLPMGAFSSCGIRELVIPGNIRELGKSAFFNCNNLEKLTVQAGVEIMSESSFGLCENLKEVIFEDSDNPIILDNLYNGGSLEYHTFQPCPLEHVYIGREIKNFEGWNNNEMTTLTIGPKLKRWHNNYYGDNLRTVKTLIENPSQLHLSFTNVIYDKATLIVPEGRIDEYKSASGWSKFKNIVEEKTSN